MGKEKIDYKSEIGKRYGKLIIKSFKDKESTVYPKYFKPKKVIQKIAICDCDCGNKNVEIMHQSLRRGLTTSCGCGKRKYPKISIGDKFNKLTVIEGPFRKNKKRYWKCKCDCGRTSEVQDAKLKNGHTKSCGCNNKDYDDIPIGTRFGKWTVVSEPLIHQGAKSYKVKCDCGNENIVSSSNLKLGKSKSCGCASALVPKNPLSSIPEIKRLHGRASALLTRCADENDPSYYEYGGRGIKCELGDTPYDVAKSLNEVPGFFEGAAIDRVDNDENYTLYHPDHGYDVWEYDDPVLKKKYQCRGNLRWLTREESSQYRFYSFTFTPEQYPLRLMTERMFTRRLKIDKLSEKDFIIYRFKLQKSPNGYDLFLCVPKILQAKQFEYAKRIEEFYKGRLNQEINNQQRSLGYTPWEFIDLRNVQRLSKR